MRRISTKIISILLSFVIVFQTAGITVFADTTADYDGNVSEKSYQVLLDYVTEGKETPNGTGIWLNASSADYFLSVISNVSSQKYSVDESGFLVQNIEDKAAFNEYDEKLKKLIGGSKTIIVSVSDTYRAYNDTLGEEYSVMLDDSDFALLFKKSKSLDIAVLNYYHFAEHTDEYSYFNEKKIYTDKELADEFLKLFYSEKQQNNTAPSDSMAEKNGRIPQYLRGASLPSLKTYTHFTAGTYGKSGLGRDLKWYKIGKGPNVVFAVFAQHGWEDAWSSDGAELVKIADRVMSNLSSMSQNIFNDWTVYVIPYANPDGITDGYTNNGPGRCTVTTKIDMNRCWPSNFKAITSSGRNYTGSSPLGAPEASQLESFISRNAGNYTNVVLDIHGWLNQTIGRPDVGNYFCREFGFSNKNSHGSGYLETWAYNKGYKSSLIELPMPENSLSIISNNYSGKLTNGLVNMMYGFTDEKPVTLGVASNLLSSRVTGISANVKWSPVEFADGYQVQILSSAGGSWQNAGTTVTNEFNFRNLSFNHSYSVRIKPFRYTSRGTDYGSYWSHSCGFKTLTKEAAAAALPAVDAIMFKNLTENSVDVSYNAVWGANMYQLQYSADKVNWETVLSTGSTSATITGLDADSSYYVRVRAYAESGNEYAMPDKYSNVYHFYTKPTEVELSVLPFKDLNDYKYYSGYVAYTSVYNSFIAGTNPPEYTLFSPQTPISRAMFVAILYRMAGNPYDNANPYKVNPFTDIKENAYYYNAACWALDKGITNQITFKPNDSVTREQTARFLFAYAQANDLIGDTDYKNISLKDYPDYSSVHSWAVEPLQWANYNSMITGTQQGYINPQGATQRIHATRILYGFGKVCNIGNFE